jgi:glycosyltransferase involved in cell wall biosynthesis
MKKVSIIIPFYNEAGNIIRLLEDLVKELSEIIDFNFELILIDDRSTDQSKNLVKSFIKDSNKFNIKLIENENNIGKTFSIKKAIELITTDFLIFMDGDYQDDPKDIKKFIVKVKEGYDLVIGYQDKNYSFFVKFCGKIYKAILNIFLGIKNVKNPSPQFMLIKHDNIKNIIFRENYHRYIAISAMYKRIKFCEVKVNFFKREYGVSKFSRFKVFGAFFEVIGLIYRLKKDIFFSK